MTDATMEAQKDAAQVKRWPFVESPGDFTDRLSNAIATFDGNLLSAVRNVLIENPPQLASDYDLVCRQSRPANGRTVERNPHCPPNPTHPCADNGHGGCLACDDFSNLRQLVEYIDERLIEVERHPTLSVPALEHVTRPDCQPSEGAVSDIPTCDECGTPLVHAGPCGSFCPSDAPLPVTEARRRELVKQLMTDPRDPTIKRQAEEIESLRHDIERHIANHAADLERIRSLEAEHAKCPKPIRTDRDPPDGGSDKQCLAWLVHENTPPGWFQRSQKVVREHPNTYPYWMPWPEPAIDAAMAEAK